MSPDSVSLASASFITFMKLSILSARNFSGVSTSAIPMHKMSLRALFKKVSEFPLCSQQFQNCSIVCDKLIGSLFPGVEVLLDEHGFSVFLCVHASTVLSGDTMDLRSLYVEGPAKLMKAEAFAASGMLFAT